MSVNCFINFDGNCREAVEFYAKVFSTSQPEFLTYANAPNIEEGMELPEDIANLIMFTQLTICGSLVMFSDILPPNIVRRGNSITVSLLAPNVELLKEYYSKLKQDATIDMELQETFFKKSYASLTDKYGIFWQLTHD